ncbi:PQQ-binding-like beta-propeller repeat protein [Pelomonas sp. SE-A7]|uniref:PQQ-binding-like beta-propeller repeat protein n=1 Tax=Pelomonas sp. SE-A7 TaxID=3054953 RepID=UPI00259D2064|nr:PQQ-binding-like beta-propeller repeat protein [Pelomonas sp. SE-A7]MDM4767387.1 PQQ-binding-like beta-propeller repeat protein [Pelomonas sp. SE-A7]
MTVRHGTLSALALAALLSGCAVVDWVMPKKGLPQETFTATLTGKTAWSTKVDSIKFPLNVVVVGDRLVVADSDGVLQALNPANGQSIWRGDIKGKPSAAVGSDGRFAAAVTEDNELVVLDAGKKVWTKVLTTPVKTAPLVAGERVFVLTVDRQVMAFDVLDGRKLWEMRRPGEPLTLNQSGVVSSYKDTLVVGQGPRLAGVDPLRGTLRWEAVVGSPRGTNEVERLADLVGPLGRSGEMLCARAFQLAVGCINAERGVQVWSRNNAGTVGVSAEGDLVLGADSVDRITAWKLSNGESAWSADQLQGRKLSAPLLTGKLAVFGDSEGFVHFLSRETGKTQLRLATDGSAVVAAPQAVAGLIVVVTAKGGVFGLKVD